MSEPTPVQDLLGYAPPVRYRIVTSNPQFNASRCKGHPSGPVRFDDGIGYTEDGQLARLLMEDLGYQVTPEPPPWPQPDAAPVPEPVVAPRLAAATRNR